MDIHVVSIFPEMFKALTEQGVVSRALNDNYLSLSMWNPRDYTQDKHRMVDDRPYGGGPGMVMMAEPLIKALQAARKTADVSAKVVYLSPQGKPFTHNDAVEFAKQKSVIFLSGRYEGIDERVIKAEVDEEWSIGDYVLSGGELPCMVIIDAITRLLPGSLGNAESAEQDSFVDGLLDCGHYTRPEQLAGYITSKNVPEVLLSGNHKAIKRWRLKQALGRTWLKRPDLLQQLLQEDQLNKEQQDLLDEFKREFETETTVKPEKEND